MLTDLQVRTSKAIIRCFEGSDPRGKYSAIAVLKGDTGGLSYGVCQATRASGNLSALVEAYCAAGGRYAGEFKPWRAMLSRKARVLDTDQPLRRLLWRAAADPIMQQVQERFFHERFWMPAEAFATKLGCRLALSYAVLYDSTVHGSRDYIVAKTDTYRGRLQEQGEKRWICNYAQARLEWLRSVARLKATGYRPRAFQALFRAENWDLALPLFVELTKELADGTVKPNGTIRLTEQNLPVSAGRVAGRGQVVERAD